MALVNKEYLEKRLDALNTNTISDEDKAAEILAEDTLEDAVCVLAGLLVVTTDQQDRMAIFNALLDLCTDDNEQEASDAEPAAGRSED